MGKKSKGIDRLITFSRTPVTEGDSSGPLYKPPFWLSRVGWRFWAVMGDLSD